MDSPSAAPDGPPEVAALAAPVDWPGFVPGAPLDAPPDAPVAEPPGVLPDEIEVMAPGSGLAQVVCSVDRSALAAGDLLQVTRARLRLVAHLQAQVLADLHHLARIVPDQGPVPGETDAGRFPWAEVEASFALGWAHGRAVDQMWFADEVVQRLPAVFDALETGQIDLAAARVIVDGVSGLDDEPAAVVADKVLARAGELTTAQLRARLRRLVIAADARQAERRARREVAGRRVRAFAGDNNLASLAGYELAPHRVAAVVERLDAIARAAKAAGDGRRMDQLRADAFLDLLTGEGIAGGGDISDGGLGTTAGAADAWGPRCAVTDTGAPTAASTAPASAVASTALPGPRKGVIELTVPLSMLMGLSDAPGELAGWGPVIAEIARKVAAEQRDNHWRFSVTNDFGEVVHHGRLRRRPSAEDIAFVRARDRTCRARGCTRAARGCDVDHTRDWAHSKDSRRCNLACLCKLHHRYKHESGAKLVALANGALAWTTAHGMQFVTHPDRQSHLLEPAELLS